MKRWTGWIIVAALAGLTIGCAMMAVAYEKRITELERSSKVMSANIDPMYQEWKDKSNGLHKSGDIYVWWYSSSGPYGRIKVNNQR